MRSIRSTLFRATIMLGILAVLAAALLVSPVGAAKKGVTKAKVKQIAANQVNKVGGPLFINVGEKAGDADTLDGVDSSGFLTKAETFTRHWSCAGTAFWPYDSATGWDGSSHLRFYTGGGSAKFSCSVFLPDGATVTQVSFSLEDSSATERLGDTELWRTNIVTAIGTETQMASAGDTGVAATPGAVQLSDPSITAPTIDNANFSYFLQLSFAGTGSDVGIYGANITYTITGSQGAGRVDAAASGGTTHGSGA